jgi:hypothetical protein
MRTVAIILVLAWLGTGVVTFAICCLIIFQPSRFTRALIVSLFGATVVIAVLTLTARPLGGLELLYRYLAHRVVATVGELRTGARPVERLTGGIAGGAGEADAARGLAVTVGTFSTDHAKGPVAGSPAPASRPGQPSSDRSRVNTEASAPRTLPTSEDARPGRRDPVPASLRNDVLERQHLQPPHHRRSRVETVDQVVRNERPVHVDKADRTDRTDAPDKIHVSAALVSDIVERRGKRPEKSQRADDFDRFDKGEQPERDENPGKAEKPEKADRVERADNPERAGKAERLEKGDRVERADNPERADKPEKVEKVEKIDKADKLEKADKPERADKVQKVENLDRVEKVEKIDKADKPERVDKVQKVEKVERVEKVDKVEKIEKVEKVDRVARVDRVEKVERVEKVTRVDRPVRPERIERPERGK